MAALSVGAMFQILQEALIARLRMGRSVHPAVAFAARQLGHSAHAVKVRDVFEQIGFSSRHLIDLFRQQTGLTPKSYQRVRRFQSVLQILHIDSDTDGASLSTSCGYYDQAHFIHDFKHFSGLTPTEYARLATPHLNHIPLG
jgi:AraC-like DNA-binding protein